jgi:hypothetical protein
MPGSRRAGLVGAVLRCYSRQWRRRHGDEAAEVALLLLRDGVPARSIAASYLMGAARERLTPRPGHRLAAAAVATLAAAGSLVTALALLTVSVPASAASSVHARTIRRDDPAARLVTLLRCGSLLGATVGEALPALEARHVTITWDMAGRRTGGDAVPRTSYYLAGGRVLSPSAVSIRVTATRPAGHEDAAGHAGHC